MDIGQVRSVSTFQGQGMIQFIDGIMMPCEMTEANLLIKFVTEKKAEADKARLEAEKKAKNKKDI